MNCSNRCNSSCIQGLDDNGKIGITETYPKMKTVILQDGTNSFLKLERKPKDVFEQYKQLVKNTDKFYLMTVIAMKNTRANMAKNRMYHEFNDLIKTYYENDPDINILDFNKVIKEIGAKTDNIGREIDLLDYENSEYSVWRQCSPKISRWDSFSKKPSNANSNRHFRFFRSRKSERHILLMPIRQTHSSPTLQAIKKCRRETL